MKALFVMGGAGDITLVSGTRHPAGFWAEEFAVPCRLFQERGYQVEVATVGGRPPILDPRSVNPEYLHKMRAPGSRTDDAARAMAWREIILNSELLVYPRVLEELNRSNLVDFDVVYLCCGLACLADRSSASLTRLLMEVQSLGLLLAAIGFGLAATLGIRDRNGRYPFAGYKLTGLSQSEERRLPFHSGLPLDLEAELVALGAEFTTGPLPWDAYVVSDRDLVTGQNPGSANLLAETLLSRLAPGRAMRYL